MKNTILVIDDEMSIRLLLDNYLSKKFTVVTRNDGFEGLKYLEEGNMPDVIVADIQMPNMDGYEFIDEVRARGFYKHIPMIMLSGIESSKERVKCLKSGADDYLVKPFNPEELAIRIENLIMRRRL